MLALLYSNLPHMFLTDVNIRHHQTCIEKPSSLYQTNLMPASDTDDLDEVFEIEEEFDISLSPTGDEGSSFRTANDPGSPYQRQNVTERKGAVDVRCQVVDVVHGLPHPDAEAFATLIVLKFSFSSRKAGRRILEVQTSLEFAGCEAGTACPEVVNIAPYGDMVLVQTSQKEDEKLSLGGKIGAPPLLGVDAGVNLAWDKSVSRETTDATKLIGSMDLIGRNYGNANSASWSLVENRTAKTGVPTSMTASILLNREDDRPFKCIFKLHAIVDWMSSIERLVGSRSRDDPVLFDPRIKPTNRLQVYDHEALDSVDLERLANVTFMTVQDNSVKHI